MMSWALFGQIVLLILIAQLVKCLHDCFCKKCKG